MSGDLKTPLAPISWGELVDKITILEIKSTRLKEDNALANVRRELDLLTSIAANALMSSQQVSSEKENLAAINKALWEIEDRIRAKEAAQIFDNEFIELARSVYRTNDERSVIKRRINKLLSSELIEEKSYKSY
jgi:hypothetical protein